MVRRYEVTDEQWKIIEPHLGNILILCADGLTGIKEAIAAAYPQTEYQRCIVHQVRNTLKYVSDKDRKAFANDLKTIYLATFEATKKWTMPNRNWGRVYGELAIMYDGRLPD